jgi:hypothetical protein
MCAGPIYGARREPPIPNHPTGTAVPDVSADAPTIEALRDDELAAGESYDSWLCACCDSVVAIARRAPDSDPFDLPDAVINIICLNCEAARPYHMHQRRVRRYPWPSELQAEAPRAIAE